MGSVSIRFFLRSLRSLREKLRRYWFCFARRVLWTKCERSNRKDL